ALGRARGVDVEIDDVGRQALGRDFEGGAGARARLEEQVHHGAPARERHFLDLALADGNEGAGGVENVENGAARQAVDGEEMLEASVGIELQAAHYAPTSWNLSASRSGPPTSLTWRPRASSRCPPATWAAIGSS